MAARCKCGCGKSPKQHAARQFTKGDAAQDSAADVGVGEQSGVNYNAQAEARDAQDTGEDTLKPPKRRPRSAVPPQVAGIPGQQSPDLAKCPDDNATLARPEMRGKAMPMGVVGGFAGGESQAQVPQLIAAEDAALRGTSEWILCNWVLLCRADRSCNLKPARPEASGHWQAVSVFTRSLCGRRRPRGSKRTCGPGTTRVSGTSNAAAQPAKKQSGGRRFGRSGQGRWPSGSQQIT